MSWPRQGSQNPLDNRECKWKTWISWVWGFEVVHAVKGSFEGALPPKCFKRILPTPRPPRARDGLRTATTPRLQEYADR